MNKRDSCIKKINIATPVVWAEASFINNFSSKVNKLIGELKQIVSKRQLEFEINKALINVYSVSDASKLNSFDFVEIQCFETSIQKRKEKGMAYWWFKSVKDAFNDSNPIDGVLYLPIDICWDNNKENTVVNPLKIIGMLESLSKGNDELLVIGNYKSSNVNKEWIESEVRNFLRSKFPSLDRSIERVRSEYWAISQKLFEIFESDFSTGKMPNNVADPTLLLIIYCLINDKQILSYDLGKYKVEGEWDQQKMNHQIERAKNLILVYKNYEELIYS